MIAKLLKYIVVMGVGAFIFLALNDRYCMIFGFQFYCNLPRIFSVSTVSNGIHFSIHRKIYFLSPYCSLQLQI